MNRGKKSVILIVDDLPENLDSLTEMLSDEFIVRSAISGEVALKIAGSLKPDLILLDIVMPSMDGFETCKYLKANPVTSNIPVIFSTSMISSEKEEEAFAVGAVDYILKPPNPSIMKARIKSQIILSNYQKSCMELIDIQTNDIYENQKAAIHMLGTAGHYNDTDTGHHIWRMADYSAALAKVAGWQPEEVEELRLAATMHDTGKIGIPDEILKAPRKLTSDEWTIMKTHSEIGHQILSKSPMPLFQLASEIAMSHHEKWDGSGYPQGLSGNAIPESARIVAIADVFDALTMKRPYKEPWPPGAAFELLINDSGTHFDKRLVDLFIGAKEEILEIKKTWEKKDEVTNKEVA